jgi:hypothetical protein
VKIINKIVFMSVKRPSTVQILIRTFKDFFLSTKLKSVLNGRRFESADEIKETSLAEQRSTTKKAFKECFQNWKKRWEGGGEMHEKCLKRTKANNF